MTLITRGLGVSGDGDGGGGGGGGSLGGFVPVFDLSPELVLDMPRGLLGEYSLDIEKPSSFYVSNVINNPEVPCGLYVEGVSIISVPEGFYSEDTNYVSSPSGFAVEST